MGRARGRRLAVGDQSDHALVERARRGDEQAFTELFRRHSRDIVAFVERRTGSGGVADDVTAVTFEKAWRSLDRLADAGERFRPWLFRIATNEMISEFRSSARRSHRERRVSAGDSRARPLDDPAATSLHGTLDHPHLRAAISTLSAGQQAVIALRFFSGLEPGEVADALDITPGAVAVRLHRALGALRNEIADRTAASSRQGRTT